MNIDNLVSNELKYIYELIVPVMGFVKENRTLDSLQNTFFGYDLKSGNKKQIYLKDRLINLFGSELYEDLDYLYKLQKKLSETYEETDPKIYSPRLRRSSIDSFFHSLIMAYSAKAIHLDQRVLRICLWHDIFQDFNISKLPIDIDLVNKLKSDGIFENICTLTQDENKNLIKDVPDRNYETTDNDYYEIMTDKQSRLENYRLYINSIIKCNRGDLTNIYVKLIERSDDTFAFANLDLSGRIINSEKNLLLLNSVYETFGEYILNKDIFFLNFKDITFSKLCPIEKLNYLHYQLNMISQFYIEKETEYLMRSETSRDEPYFKQEINQLNDLKVKFQQELEKMFIR